MSTALACDAARLEAEGHAKLAEAARLRARGVEAVGGGDELVPRELAARRAATSIRVMREAIRAGALTAYGRQRDRSVRAGDLAAWIESRRAPAVLGAEDADMERRIARLARQKREEQANVDAGSGQRGEL